MGVFERSIQSRTVTAITKRWPSAFVRVKHGDAYAVVGDPDIYGCVASRMFGFEVKNETGRLTKIQQYRLMELAKAGAIQSAIQSPEEAVQIIERYFT